MQRLSAGVEAEGARALARRYVSNVDVEPEVGVADGDVGAFARLLAELVDDGILHFVTDELRVTELFREDHSVYGKGLVEVEVLAPVHLHHLVVHVLGREGAEMGDGLENADGSMELEVSTIKQFLVAGERHHASAYLYVVSPQLGQFLRQNGLKSHKGLGDDFKCLFHYVIKIRISAAKVRISEQNTK